VAGDAAHGGHRHRGRRAQRLVIADGAGSADLDRLEAEAVHRTFGERAARVPVTAPQGFVGRLYSGGAPLNSERQPPGAVLDQPFEGVLYGRSGRQRAPGEQPQHRSRTEHGDQHPKCQRGELVSPVHVVEHDEQRPGPRVVLDRVADAVDEQQSAPFRAAQG